MFEMNTYLAPLHLEIDRVAHLATLKISKKSKMLGKWEERKLKNIDYNLKTQSGAGGEIHGPSTK